MGFYAPAQIVRDAREKGGVEVRAIDINASDWDNGIETTRHAGLVPASNFPQALAPVARWTPEQVRGDGPALRLGLRQIDGFREDWAIAIAAARGAGPFAGIDDLARRASLPPRALRQTGRASCRERVGQYV